MASKTDNFYFNGFIEQADFSVQIIQKIMCMVEQYDPSNLRTAMDEMHLLEHTADIKHHMIMEQLMKEFMPPIEREDIISLSQLLDDLADYLEDIPILLYTYHVHEIEKPMCQFLEIIEQSVSQVKKLMEAFGNFKHDRSLHKYIVDINRLEENGDIFYHDFLFKVFAEEHDARYLIRQKELFTKFEGILDTAEDIANEVANVIMKNS